MKKIFIIFVILILTGCTVNVDFKIDDQLNINETINIDFDNSLASNYFTPYDYAKDSVEYYYDKIYENNYSYSIKQKDINSSVIFTKKSENICDNVNSYFSKELYENINCTSNEEYIVIESEGVQKLSLPMKYKTFNVENLSISVTLPVKATKSNADIVNESTYIWKYNKNTSGDKSFYLKISKEELENKLARQKIDKVLDVGKVIVVILLIGFSTGIVLYRLYKKNQIEY